MVRTKTKEKKKGKIGRPPDSESEKFDLAQVRELGKLGLIDEEIATLFNVDEATLNGWKKKYPKFWQALKEGKAESDNEVVRRLFKRATGFKTREITKERRNINGKRGSNAVYEVVVTKVVEKELAPDTLAGMFWLQNRRRHTYRRTNEKDGGGSGVLSEEESKVLKQAAAKLMEANS